MYVQLVYDLCTSRKKVCTKGTYLQFRSHTTVECIVQYLYIIITSLVFNCNKHNNCKSFNREIKVYSTVALQTTNYCNASLVLVNTIIGLKGELLSFSNNISICFILF